MSQLYAQDNLLSFISNDALFHAVEKVLKKADTSVKEDKDFYKNSVDPFSALFEAALADVTLESWAGMEKRRQKQKTLQNAVGEFHEDVLGSVAGWERLPVGNVFDVVNNKLKIITEIKNKHSTTKGSDRKSIYTNLLFLLGLPEYQDFTGYYVEIISKGARSYNTEFTPSNNITKTRMPENPKIRIIDGKSFYSLATGDPLALEKLYRVLPTVISSLLSTHTIKDYNREELFSILFSKAFS